MSKLVKSKFLLGLAIAAVVAVGGASHALAYTHTVTLKMGSTGSQVMSLQQALNAAGNTVSATGAGSAGMESTFFGAKTKAAVMGFQTAHALTADGVVGPKTGAALSGTVVVAPGSFPAGCTSNTGFSTTTGQSCAMSTTLPAGCTSTAGFSPTTGQSCGTGSSTALSGGETTITDVRVDTADDTTLEEGASKVDAAHVKFKVKDADAQLVRADITFVGTGNDEDRPWNAFDKVYLMNGSTVIASLDASSKDAWDETDVNDVYRIRFAGLTQVFKESASADLTVAVDVNSSVDGAGSSADWTVQLDTDALRFLDSAGVDTFADTSDSADFSIDAAGHSSQLTIIQSSSSPDAGTLEVDESTSKTQTVAIFQLKADSAGGDILVNDLPVDITFTDPSGGVSDPSYSTILSDVYLKIDGKTYTGDWNGTNSNCANTTSLSSCHTGDVAQFNFSDLDDDDVTIDSGQKMDAEVMIKFKAEGQNATNYDNGTTVDTGIDYTANDFEDSASGDDIGDVSPSAGPGTEVDGETQNLFGHGISVSNFTSSVTTNSDNDGNTTTANYTVSFKVMAFGDTFYIPKTLVRGTTSASAGLTYTIEDGSGNTSTTAGAAASQLTSSADTVGSNFEVPEGETETFTATISVTKGTSTPPNFFRVQLNDVGYATDGGVTGYTQLDLTPTQDYETAQVNNQA